MSPAWGTGNLSSVWSHAPKPLVDPNVQFQDAARLIQRLIELEKDFEVMVYPVQAHTVQAEASRYDLFRREAAFFDEKLRGIHR